jgi:hypothetical protein
MNSQQLKYARARANAILSKRTKAIRERWASKEKRLSPTEKLAALKAGEFAVKKPLAGVDRYWWDYVIFTKEIDTDTVGMNTELATLHEEFTKLMDELMLGDQEVALKALKAFEQNA